MLETTYINFAVIINQENALRSNKGFVLIFLLA